MNEELKTALLDLLKDFQNAKDFCIEQTPDIIQQMVAYEAAMAWSWIAFGVCICTGIWILTLRIVKALKKSECLDSRVNGPPVVFGISFFITPLILLLFIGKNLGTAIKATWFEKWFIVEKIMELVG